jgi:hypothetical protein
MTEQPVVIPDSDDGRAVAATLLVLVGIPGTDQVVGIDFARFAAAIGPGLPSYEQIETRGLQSRGGTLFWSILNEVPDTPGTESAIGHSLQVSGTNDRDYRWHETVDDNAREQAETAQRRADSNQAQHERLVNQVQDLTTQVHDNLFPPMTHPDIRGLLSRGDTRYWAVLNLVPDTPGSADAVGYGLKVTGTNPRDFAWRPDSGGAAAPAPEIVGFSDVSLGNNANEVAIAVRPTVTHVGQIILSVSTTGVRIKAGSYTVTFFGDVDATGERFNPQLIVNDSTGAEWITAPNYYRGTTGEEATVWITPLYLAADSDLTFEARQGQYSTANGGIGGAGTISDFRAFIQPVGGVQGIQGIPGETGPPGETQTIDQIIGDLFGHAAAAALPDGNVSFNIDIGTTRDTSATIGTGQADSTFVISAAQAAADGAFVRGDYMLSNVIFDGDAPHELDLILVDGNGAPVGTHVMNNLNLFGSAQYPIADAGNYRWRVRVATNGRVRFTIMMSNTTYHPGRARADRPIHSIVDPLINEEAGARRRVDSQIFDDIAELFPLIDAKGDPLTQLQQIGLLHFELSPSVIAWPSDAAGRARALGISFTINCDNAALLRGDAWYEITLAGVTVSRGRPKWSSRTNQITQNLDGTATAAVVRAVGTAASTFFVISFFDAPTAGTRIGGVSMTLNLLGSS